MSNSLDLYPVAIFEDRYGGAYSGGAWLAVSRWDSADRQRTLEAAHGSDEVAMQFWADPPSWVAVGATPNAALKALDRKMGVFR